MRPWNRWCNGRLAALSKVLPREGEHDADKESEQRDHDPQMDKQRAELYVGHFSETLMIARSPTTSSSLWLELQEFYGLNPQDGRKLADDLKAGIAPTLFELAHVS